MIKKRILAVAAALSVFLPSFVFASEPTVIDPVGTNIVDSGGTVYMIAVENGQTVRRPYTSAGAFLSYGFNSFGNLSRNYSGFSYPVGSFIPPQDGKIVCSDRGADKGTCYIITGGKKAAFTSADVFAKLGYSFNRALYGDVSFLINLANINTSAEAHVPGTLVNKDGTIYLVGPTADASALFGIPDMATFNSWGYLFADVVLANSFDRVLPLARNVGARTPGALSPFDVNQTQSAIQINYLSPNSGPIGSMVTIVGSGFLSEDKLSFGNSSLGSQTGTVSSADGKTIIFTIPSEIVPTGSGCVPPMYCVSPAPRPVVPGSYDIYVTNANGTSNALSFIVASVSGGSINIISPAGGEQWAVGSAQIVKWTPPSSVTNVNITLSPYIACLYSNPSCMIAEINPYPVAANVPNTGNFNWTVAAAASDGRAIPSGQYILNIVSAGGSLSGRSAAPFNIVASASVPVISSLNPSSGAVGTQVTIFGSNFTATGNSARFMDYAPVGGNLSSTDGKTLQFTVPSLLYPNCASGMACPQYVLSVTPGNYQITVTNANGTSNSQTFTVTR